jgi:hypothetical protein|tara:strand:+ start:148 stop:876 length:729 start_codon:yes stop_codon:yes gene_type:complete
MKIAFCGDSYCEHIGTDPYLSYPYLVAKEFNAEILSRGLGGRALFHAYETLMENIDRADYIIFCITEPHRLANRYRIPLSVPGLARPHHYNPEDIISGALSEEIEIGKKLSEKVERGARLYYEEIMSYEYHEVAHRGLLREIDVVIKEYKKKCIFFKGFDNSFLGWRTENAVWGNLNLWDIQDTEVKNMTKKERDKIKKLVSDPRTNHMNEQNNRNMANFIIDVIKQDDFTPRELDMREYFK